MMGRLLAVFAVWLACAFGAQAQDLSALARIDMTKSGAADAGDGLSLTLDLSQPVPFRLRLLAGPPRLVADFREVDWTGAVLGAFTDADTVETAQAGAVQQGWSRLVLELDGAYTLQSAEMRRDDLSGRAVLDVRLVAGDPIRFAATAASEDAVLWGGRDPETLDPPQPRQDGTRPLRVVLDPGHGGIDPGAVRGDVIEADLMLTFARELRDVLRRAGVEVLLTREDDSFVPLETRITVARAGQADLFLSLHADVVAEGNATGATVYTLSDKASDKAAQLLAERHDRADLLAGVDLAEQDDTIALVLMDLARTETTPRSEAMAGTLVDHLKRNIGRMHKRPHQHAGFSVLKAADIPSVLLELGFLSSDRDRKNLVDAEWRAKVAVAIRDAVLEWRLEDAAQAGLLRQ